MRPSHISYAFLGSFLAAVFGLQWWQSPAYPWNGILVLGIFGLFGIFSPRTRILTAGILGIIIAMLSVAHSTHSSSPMTIDAYASDRKISIRGRIADDPDRREDKTNYIVAAELMRKDGKTLKTSGRVLVSMTIGTKLLEYGDEVTLDGLLELPESDDDFRYDNYLSVKNVYSVMRDPQMKPTGKNDANVILKSIYRFRRATESLINRLLPEPHASLLAGLLLGSRGSMPASLTNEFKTTGLTHLVAISGYNITMLITVMGTLLFWLPLKWRFWPSVMLIIAFTLLTGASASAVRAAVMGMLGLGATQLNRVQTTRLTVMWSAFFMLAWNPAQLWYDAGFQLSFLALIGVLEISPHLQPYFRRLPEMFGIRESLCLTMSAQMLASAWICYLFGQLSLIAPLSNLLAPPAVPYATLLGVGAVSLGAIWEPLGRIASVIALLPLKWITGVAYVLASLPFAAVQFEGLSTLWLTLYFAGIAAWIINANRIAAMSSSCPSRECDEPRRVVVAGTGTRAR